MTKMQNNDTSVKDKQQDETWNVELIDHGLKLKDKGD